MGSHKSLCRICELRWAVIQCGKTSSGKGHLKINITALGSLWTQWHPIYPGCWNCRNLGRESGTHHQNHQTSQYHFKGMTTSGLDLFSSSQIWQRSCVSELCYRRTCRKVRWDRCGQVWTRPMSQSCIVCPEWEGNRQLGDKTINKLCVRDDNMTKQKWESVGRHEFVLHLLRWFMSVVDLAKFLLKLVWKMNLSASWTSTIFASSNLFLHCRYVPTPPPVPVVLPISNVPYGELWPDPISRNTSFCFAGTTP